MEIIQLQKNLGLITNLAAPANTGNGKRVDLDDKMFTDALSKARVFGTNNMTASKSADAPENAPAAPDKDDSDTDNESAASAMAAVFFASTAIVNVNADAESEQKPDALQTTDVLMLTDSQSMIDEPIPAEQEITADESGAFESNTAQITADLIHKVDETQTIEPVVVILESNQPQTDVEPQAAMDSDAQPVTTEPQAEISSATEEPARMPRQTGQIESAAPETELMHERTERNGDPYPLENDNEISNTANTVARKTAPANKGDEPNSEDGGKQDTAFASQFAQAIDVAPERAVSSQQIDSLAQGAAVTTDNLVDTIVERIVTTQADGSRTMEIQLKPEFLGKVTIVLTMTDNVLRAKISAEDLSVRNMLNGQIENLKNTLDAKGIQVADVEVAYTGVGDRSFDGTQSGNDAAPRRNPRGTRTITVDATTAPMWEDSITPVIDDELSSVEYRA